LGSQGWRELRPGRVEGSMAWHGNMEPRRPKPKPSTETKNHVSPKASLKCKWNWVPCRVGIDEWRCGCRHGITRHVAMMMREAASCGYVVRVAGHASSCAHIVSHPLSAACRLVSSSRRAYLRKVEAARGQGNSSTNPSPASSLGRASGIISRSSYTILVWADSITSRRSRACCLVACVSDVLVACSCVSGVKA